MQAEQSVALSVTRADGTVDRRTMRAVLAVARPDRFALRALGPGGVTLFDLLYRDGKVDVRGGILPKHDAFAAVVASVAGDLATAYALHPTAQRTTQIDRQAATIADPERVVRLSHFVRLDGKALPLSIDVDAPAHHYRVHVTVTQAALEVALDPALFAE